MKPYLQPVSLDPGELSCPRCGHAVLLGVTVKGNNAYFDALAPNMLHHATCPAEKQARKRLQARKVNGKAPQTRHAAQERLVQYGKGSDTTEVERAALDARIKATLAKETPQAHEAQGAR